jgi:pyrroloquinoline quinone (PQQ) biosynthesis protein C
MNPQSSALVRESLAPDWSGLLDWRLIERLDATPFLQRCRNGTITRRELLLFAVQQFHYSRHFTRYLCALLAAFPGEGERAALIENLFEEMGLGGLGEKPHSLIYAEMLAAWGLDARSSQPLPSTQALVDEVLLLCRQRDPMAGLGALCLGAEAILPHLYSQLVAGFRAAGFSDRELYFFHLHIEGDDEHALTMKKIIEAEIQRDPTALVRLKRAAQRAISRRIAFFEGLTEASRELLQ